MQLPLTKSLTALSLFGRRAACPVLRRQITRLREYCADQQSGRNSGKSRFFAHVHHAGAGISGISEVEFTLGRLVDMAIERGKVELAQGAITPVSRGLWHAAWEKLAEAAAGAMQMQEANNRVEFEAGWTRLVDSLEEFWTRFFDEGRSKFSSFQPWAGAIDAQRKQDPLLTYLYQARHQSQHGRIALEWAEGQIQIGGGEFFGTIKNLQISAGGNFQADVTSHAGSEARFKVIHDPGNARLPTVTNKKHNQVFAPPASHQGIDIGGISPIDAGQLGIKFYDDVLQKALSKFGKAP